MGVCDDCKILVESALNAIMDDSGEFGCGVLATEFEVECIGLAGKQENPIFDIDCGGASGVLEGLCQEKGIDWMINNIAAAAKLVCQKMGICS